METIEEVLTSDGSEEMITPEEVQEFIEEAPTDIEYAPWCKYNISEAIYERKHVSLIQQYATFNDIYEYVLGRIRSKPHFAPMPTYFLKDIFNNQNPNFPGKNAIISLFLSLMLESGVHAAPVYKRGVYHLGPKELRESTINLSFSRYPRLMCDLLQTQYSPSQPFDVMDMSVTGKIIGFKYINAVDTTRLACLLGTAFNVGVDKVVLVCTSKRMVNCLREKLKSNPNIQNIIVFFLSTRRLISIVINTVNMDLPPCRKRAKNDQAPCKIVTTKRSASVLRGIDVCLTITLCLMIFVSLVAMGQKLY